MKFFFPRKIPNKLFIAYSGGVDSSALLRTFINMGKDITLLWVDHNTQWCNTEREFALQTSEIYNIPLIQKQIDHYDKSTSLERFWSEQRNSIFKQMDGPVATGHNLDDAVESWVMGSMQGQPKLLSFKNDNIIRPLIFTKRSEIEHFNKVNKVPFIVDPTNGVTTGFGLRNQIRTNLMPTVFSNFPGLHKTVKKLIIKSIER
jgi:tRNA(Ile)-lysidine synthase